MASLPVLPTNCDHEGACSERAQALGDALGSGRLGLVDLASPSAGLRTTRLDVLLEAVHVCLGPTPDEAELVPDRLGDPLGLDLQLEHDLAATIAQPVEGDHPRLLAPSRAPPRDAVIRHSIGPSAVQ